MVNTYFIFYYIVNSFIKISIKRPFTNKVVFLFSVTKKNKTNGNLFVIYSSLKHMYDYIKTLSFS